MAVNIYNLFVDQIKDRGLTLENFQDITIYLLDKGIICRNETDNETKYYDHYIRLEDIIIDYLNLININVVHDEDFESIRVYAPGSDFPNNYEDIDNSSNMVLNINSEESAYLIGLTILYDQKFSEGKIAEDMSVEVSIEEFNTVLATYLSYTPTENKSQRDQAFKTLKNLRAIQYSKNVFEDEDKPLIIRPYIKQIILPHMIASYINDNSNSEEKSNEN